MATLVAVVLRRLRRQATERWVEGRLPRGPDGVIVGAQPIRLGAGGRGALLLHGFGDTPQSLHPLAEALYAGGWTIRVPLLAGHGRSLAEFSRSRATDWLGSARAALEELRRECGAVSVVGQSMGGALATILAAREGGVQALALLAPYVGTTPGVARVARFHRAAALVAPYLRTGTARSIADPAARQAALGFGVTTPRLLRELFAVADAARAAAPAVHVPALVLASPDDPRVPKAAFEAAFAGLRAAPRRLRWLDRSRHVLAVDRDRAIVAGEVLAWLDAHTVGPGAPSPGPGAG